MGYGTAYIQTFDINGDGVLDIIFVTQLSNGIYLSIGNVSNYVNPTGVLVGQVINSEGNPVANATVIVMLPRATYIANTTTDEYGWFTITNIPAETYQVAAYWVKENGSKAYAYDYANIEPGATVNTTLYEYVEEAPTITTTVISTTTTPPQTQTTTTTIVTQTQTTQTTASPAITSPTTTTPETKTTATTTRPPPGIDTTTILLIALVAIAVVGWLLAFMMRRSASTLPPPSPPPLPP
ncbi:MAG: carboxypeptidase regulatory-like domain-containing protein [Desulfurococcales archaeon]|nr:carboxypeptidase regulatory-like domain-containing protein [Desulfurococcales archaeon]